MFCRVVQCFGIDGRVYRRGHYVIDRTLAAHLPELERDRFVVVLRGTPTAALREPEGGRPRAGAQLSAGTVESSPGPSGDPRSQSCSAPPSAASLHWRPREGIFSPTAHGR